MKFEKITAKWYVRIEKSNKLYSLGTGELSFNEINEIFVLNIIIDQIVNSSPFTIKPENYNYIYGITDKKTITLFNCYWDSWEITNILKCKFISRNMIEGLQENEIKNIKKIDDIELDYIQLQLPENMVAQISFPERFSEMSNNDVILDDVPISIKKPKKINKNFTINLKEEIEINIYNDLSGKYNFSNRFYLTQNINFKISIKNKRLKIIDIINTTIIPIKNYLSFLLNSNAGDFILTSKINDQPITIYFTHILCNNYKHINYKRLGNINTIFEDLETWIQNSNKDYLFYFQFFYLLYYTPISNIYVEFKEICSLVEKAEILGELYNIDDKKQLAKLNKIYLTKALNNKYKNISENIAKYEKQLNYGTVELAYLKNFKLDTTILDDLYKNTYIDDQNKITDKFKKLENSSQMVLNENFEYCRQTIFDILKQLIYLEPYRKNRDVENINKYRNHLTHCIVDKKFDIDDNKISKYSYHLEKLLKLFILFMNFKNEKNILHYISRRNFL